jgi:hypothetical protein
MKIRSRFSCFLLVVVGCATGLNPTPIAPQPITVKLPQRPASVLQRTIALLTADGFEIAASDAALGSLTAKRVRGPKGQEAAMACRFHHNSILANNQKSTFTLSLSAAPIGADSSSVIIRGSVFSEYPGLGSGPLSQSPSSTDCASNNSIESTLRDSLTTSR